MRSRLQLLNFVLAPLTGVTGDDWKDAKVGEPAKPSKRRKKSKPGERVFRMGDAKTDAEKEAGLIAAFRSVGGFR